MDQTIFTTFPITLANGIGDAFHSLHLLLGWLAILTIGGLTFLAFMTKKRRLHLISFAMCVPFAMILVPWSTDKLDLDDPDFGYQFRELHSLAYASHIVMAFAGFGFLYFCVHKVLHRKAMPEPTPADS